MSIRNAVRKKVLLWRAQKRSQRQTLEREIVAVGPESVQLWRRTLFCMPPVRELLPDWQECADKFCHKNPAAKLDILTTGTHADMYRNNRHVGQVITYTPRSFTWLGFPRLELCDQILGNSYDLIVDCHRPPDLLVAYLVGLCQKAFRVGLQADQSHLFYNVSVAPQGERYLDLVCKTVMLF